MAPHQPAGEERTGGNPLETTEVRHAVRSVTMTFTGNRDLSDERKADLMAAPFRVVITDFLDEANVEIPLLEGLAEVQLAKATCEEELFGKIEAADALILYHDIPRVGGKTFEQAPRCRVLVRAGVGFNNVDLKAAERHQILVCNVPDYGTEEVADHSIALLLAVTRRILTCDALIRGGTWNFHSALEAPRLRGKTLGLVGCGRIGMATALRAKAFGLDVAFSDPFARPGLDKAIGIRKVEKLEELMEQSSFISLHCYLDETTYHLINDDTLSRMPAGGVIVNTARGGVIDGESLLRALDSGKLLGAGLDVVEKEPLDDERLRHHPRVIWTPHSAFYSIEGFVELRTKTAEEVRRVLTGQPPRCPVNDIQVKRVP